MRRPEDKVILSDGTGFFVGEDRYKAHLKIAKESTQRSTCNDHKAVNQANADRLKLEATGIGAGACARHGCFVPHSIVDFQKGERQMNMDYSVCQALAYNSDGITNVHMFYDIICQYFVHFYDRVKSNPYLSIRPNLTIDELIGLFHIHGHQDKCFTRHAPNFVPNAGQVDGEILETLWAPLNEVSGSTRGMAKFHRRETLDDHMNDSNWKKLVNMGKL
jgi:hypothetical protein